MATAAAAAAKSTRRTATTDDREMAGASDSGPGSIPFDSPTSGQARLQHEPPDPGAGLLRDQLRAHELVVLVVQDVAVLHVAGAVRGIEREVVRSRNGAAGRVALRRDADRDSRDLAREH